MMREVQRHDCANGLPLLIWERHDAPVVSVRIGVHTGSMSEGSYAGSGISHLTEHMVFKGTRQQTAAQLNEHVASLGGIWNAWTGAAHTVFHIDGPSRHWASFMHQLVELTLHPSFPRDEWERERNVIRREREMCADDPEDVLQRALAETLYCTHPARFPVIGVRGIFDGLSYEDMLRYHAERYVPGNMFMIVVGNVKTADVVEAAQVEMSQVAPRAWPHPALAPEPRQWASRVCRREFAQSMSSLCLAWRIPNRHHPDMAPLSMLASILGCGRSAWLQRFFHDELGMAHDTAAYLMPHEPGQGAFVLRMDVERARRDTLRDELVRYVRRLPESDYAEALARVKQNFHVQRLKEMTTISSAADVLTATWCSARNASAYAEWGDALQAVTPQDVRRVAGEFLLSPCITEVSVDPIGSNALSRPVGETARRLPARVTPLPNGLRCVSQRVASCPLTFISLVVGGGSRAEDASQAGPSALLAELLPLGTHTLSADQIAARVDAAGASLETSSGNNSLVISLRCLPQDAPAMLELLADVAMHPALAKKDVAIAREDQLAGLREELLSPVCLARRELRSLCYGTGVYGFSPTGTLRSVSALTPAKLRRLDRRLCCGKNAVLAMVGAVEPRKLMPVVRRVFAEMPPGEALESRPSPPMGTRSKRCSPAEPTNQAAYAMALPALPLRHRCQPMLMLLDEWCSDMAGPLYKELREKRGLVYHVGSEILQGVDAGAFFLQLETAPFQLGAARAALHGVLKKMARQAISAPELERARATALSSSMLYLQSPARRATGMALDVLLGLGEREAERMCEELSKVTLAQMRRFVRSILSPQQPRCAVSVVSPPSERRKPRN